MDPKNNPKVVAAHSRHPKQSTIGGFFKAFALSAGVIGAAGSACYVIDKVNPGFVDGVLETSPRQGRNQETVHMFTGQVNGAGESEVIVFKFDNKGVGGFALNRESYLESNSIFVKGTDGFKSPYFVEKELKDALARVGIKSEDVQGDDPVEAMRLAMYETLRSAMNKPEAERAKILDDLNAIQVRFTIMDRILRDRPEIIPRRSSEREHIESPSIVVP